MTSESRRMDDRPFAGESLVIGAPFGRGAILPACPTDQLYHSSFIMAILAI